MTDQLHQLMLINILLYQFLKTKVSQGNVVTRLRCCGLINDQFILWSMLNSRVKLRSGLCFFMKHGVYYRPQFSIQCHTWMKSQL